MRIIYTSENDIKDFDFNRYYESLNRYGTVSKEAIEKALNELHYDPLHYSVLVETGVSLLPDDESAKRYWDDHHTSERGFERLRRIGKKFPRCPQVTLTV